MVLELLKEEGVELVIHQGDLGFEPANPTEWDNRISKIFGENAFYSYAKKYKLKILEDCAEAHGVKYKNKVVGSFSELSAFSFFSNKSMLFRHKNRFLVKD